VGDRERRVLGHPRQVDEAEVDELETVALDEVEDVLGGLRRGGQRRAPWVVALGVATPGRSCGAGRYEGRVVRAGPERYGRLPSRPSIRPEPMVGPCRAAPSLALNQETDPCNPSNR